MHREPTSTFQFSELADYLESIVLCKEQLLISGNFDIHVDNAVGSDAIKLIDLSQAARLCGRWLLDFKNYVPSHPRGGGEGTATYGLYRYVPLRRVWVSSSLL